MVNLCPALYYPSGYCSRSSPYIDAGMKNTVKIFVGVSHLVAYGRMYLELTSLYWGLLKKIRLALSVRKSSANT